MPQILRSNPIDINPKFLHVGYSSSEQHQFNDQLSSSSDVSSDDGSYAEPAIDFYYSSTSQSQLFYPSSPTSPSSPSFSSNWIQEIVEACRLGDEYLVNQLLEEMVQAQSQMKKEEYIKTYNINALERTTKRAAIHWCMASNHVNILLSLLTTFSSGEIVLDVNLREQKTGATPLHIAVATNSMDCMLLFLNTNFVFSRLEREAKDVYGNTFFHVAYRLRRFEVMDKLIEIFGNDVINSKKTSSETCVHIAAKKSDSKGLNWLIKRGAKIHSRDENGRRPLISAIYNYRESCNSEGLINGHNNLVTPQSPNTQIQIGQSLHSADSKEEATCRKSKKRKSDNSSGKRTSEDMDFPPEITNRMKRSLCYCILIQKEVELICGGSIKKWIKNETECPEGINLFHQAALNGNKEFLSVCSLLMDRKHYNQLLEKKDKRKYNILHFACEGGHYPVLELLCNQFQEMYPNSDQLKQIFNAKDSTPLQETPVHKAARRMESLIESKTNNEITPEKENAIECMTYLMYSNYTEMNIKSQSGETPNDILQRCGFFSSQLFLYNKKNKV